MGASKQRQDMVFLALAAAVLAIAVALFVVMRSVSKDGKEPVAPEPPPQVAETPPEPPKPEPTENRDPFKTQPKGSVAADGPVEPVPGPQVDLRFVGFTEGQGQGAIATIRRGERRYFVRTGDTVRGYTVTSVEQNRVVLTGAGGEAVLLLREPAEEE
jgi:hypothetical protein